MRLSHWVSSPSSLNLFLSKSPKRKFAFELITGSFFKFQSYPFLNRKFTWAGISRHFFFRFHIHEKGIYTKRDFARRRFRWRMSLTQLPTQRVSILGLGPSCGGVLTRARTAGHISGTYNLGLLALSTSFKTALWCNYRHENVAKAVRFSKVQDEYRISAVVIVKLKG